jgi:hypothetical protein
VVRGNDNRVITSEDLWRQVHAFQVKAVFSHFGDVRKVRVAIALRDAARLLIHKLRTDDSIYLLSSCVLGVVLPNTCRADMSELSTVLRKDSSTLPVRGTVSHSTSKWLTIPSKPPPPTRWNG